MWIEAYFTGHMFHTVHNHILYTREVNDRGEPVMPRNPDLCRINATFCNYISFYVNACTYIVGSILIKKIPCQSLRASRRWRGCW